MFLNQVSGRSFKDITQYPVFPWILKNFEEEHYNPNITESFRPLSKTIGALGDDKRIQAFQQKFEVIDDFNPVP